MDVASNIDYVHMQKAWKIHGWFRTSFKGSLCGLAMVSSAASLAIAALPAARLLPLCSMSMATWMWGSRVTRTRVQLLNEQRVQDLHEMQVG